MRIAQMLYSENGLPLRDEANPSMVLFVYEDNGQTLSVPYDIVKAFQSKNENIIVTDNEGEPFQLKFNVDVEKNEISEQNSNTQENETCLGWDDRSTKLLLSLYRELRPQVGKTVAFKTQTKMWNIISRRMKEKKCKFTPVQITNRFKTLERSYKKMIDNNNKTGRGHKRIQYEQELEEILGKKARILPPAIIGRRGLNINDITSGEREQDISEDLNESEILSSGSHEKADDTENLEETILETKGMEKTDDTEKPKETGVKKESIKKGDTKENMQETVVRKRDGKTALLLQDINKSLMKNSEHMKNLIDEKSKSNEHLKEANILRKERNELLKELILNKNNNSS